MTSKKNIFVFGATGMVGTAFEQKVSNTQHSLFKINRDFFDVEKDQLTRELISGADYVVNFAGIINSKIQNTHEKSVYCFYTLFPVKLADICDSSNIPLIHMSTD
ncbi:MAG: sugar nucleotide-binding protein [Alphaproteobacteria bacterium]|nr:sugar nucleotide-binding protein [Alphaproteobacteria bacterium]